MADESIPWKETKHPGIAIKFFRDDPESGDATVLIRMAPGKGYPPHRHNGVEEIYVVQGGYRDRWGEHLEGDYVCNEAGSCLKDRFSTTKRNRPDRDTRV